ncbi:MAG TPA: class I SAM-dependent methyltransferase [bacterium]|nr:class I SAM-dependent methyltransferase [bacterium]
MRENPYDREPGYAVRYRDRRFRTGSGAATDRRERRALRRLLRRAATAPGPWLDVPCGAGRLTDELPGSKVQVDRDPTMVAAIDAPHPKACASVHALPFADGTFGGALCMRLLQHIPTGDERVAILRELRRVTRGPLLASFFDANSLQHLRRRLRPLFGRRRSGRHAVSRRTFARELAAAGFEVVAMKPLLRFVGEQTLVLALPRMRESPLI